jgi:urease accessory protein
MVDATKTARELREASRSTGLRRLHALLESGALPLLASFAHAIDEGRAQGHHTVVFGAGLSALPQRAVLTSWAFQSLSALCLAAPKLLRVGQDAAQRVLTATLRTMEANVTRSLAIPRDDVGWFDSLTDLASMQHETAHERLFIS